MSTIAAASAPATELLRARGRATAARDGARLALGATAVAVALLPLLVPHGPSNTSPIDVAIIGAVGATLLWVTSAGRRLRFPYAAPLVVFMTGGALGAMAGPVPGQGVIALSQDLMLLAWCWTVVNVGSTPGRLKVLLTTWAYSSMVWATILLGAVAVGSPTVAGQAARQGGRTALTFVDPTYSANYYFISIMIICATQTPRRRSVRFLAYGLLLASLFTTGSNSGVMSIVLGVVTAKLVAVYHRRGAAAVVAGFAAIVVAGALISANVSMQSIEERAHSSQYKFIREGIGRGGKSVGQRQTLVHESAHLYETGGLLGQGPVSTKTRLEAEMAPFVKEAHNDYFAALTERGPIGVFGLFLLISTIVLRARILATTRLSRGFSAVVVRPGALLGALAGTLASSAVYELLHVRHVWTLFAVIAALFIWGRGEDERA